MDPIRFKVLSKWMVIIDLITMKKGFNWIENQGENIHNASKVVNKIELRNKIGTQLHRKSNKYTYIYHVIYINYYYYYKIFYSSTFFLH